jgi:lysophospholipase L1-like esterase
MPVATSAPAVRMLALGDSYTFGEAVAADEGWPRRLVALMRARGIPTADPVIVAQTGWTTEELSAGIDAARPAGSYDLVTLLIGVNNQFRGRGAEEYRTDFRWLLARAIASAGTRAPRVIVLSIPDWGVTPFAVGRDRAKIGTEIDRFNAIAQDETARAGAHYVDITPVSRRAATEHELIAGDGLHPSGTMYAEWARLALPAALDALGAAASKG